MFGLSTRTLENHRRRIILIMMPVGALACLLGRELSHQLNLFDLVFEPLLAALLGLLTLLMGFRWVSLRFVEAGLVCIVALYQLLGLAYFSVKGDLFQVGLSATAMWFPVLYALAYLVMSPGGAAAFSLGYFILALLALPLGWAFGHRFNGSVVNSVVQFYLVNLVYLALIGFYARYQREHDRLKRLAHSDPLTGLANRRRAEELIALELIRSTRYGQPFSVLVLDLDHFKQVNDRYGHAVGDQVLREVGFRLSKALRESDVLARWGGEEFLVFAPNTDLQQAQALAERLSQALSSKALWNDLAVSASIGVATAQPGDTVEELVSRADRAMYEAKAQGRNRIALQSVGG
ncbi:MAG: GGDEF domain-containing protein [Thermaceae bacterium]|nr:GGDEF domain-containing protein [Thermaceae bacterium]